MALRYQFEEYFIYMFFGIIIIMTVTGYASSTTRWYSTSHLLIGNIKKRSPIPMYPAM